MELNRLYRAMVLGVAERSWVRRLVETKGFGLVRRFVAGERMEDALAVIEALEHQGIHGILDLLGEGVVTEAKAEALVQQITELVEAFAKLPYPRYVSVKLSQLGLMLSEELAYSGMVRILTAAKPHDVFVRIDMEDSSSVNATLSTYRSLRKAGFDNVGTVLQSCLRRSEDDLEALLPLKPKLRIVKGAYAEPPEVAFQDKATVDRMFIRLSRRNLLQGGSTAIATHDGSVLRDIKAFIAQNRLPEDRYEFQMLYGIRRDLQKSLACEGHTVRAYVPYGNHWYPYFSRRIAERPENALFVIRGMLKG